MRPREPADGQPDVSVLLLEAGPPDSSVLIHMPSAFAYPLQGDTYNWAYETEPEPHMDGRRVSCPRGRVIGGSSSINGMVYIRGHPKDYDGWAAARGLEPWSYAHCVPYFKRSETRLNGADDYHGGDGPLYVTTGEIKVSQVSKCACTVRYSGRVRVHGFRVRRLLPVAA